MSSAFDSDQTHYRISAIPEQEGPIADFCPERTLDLLWPTENRLALGWRERCRERLIEEMGEAPSPSMH